MTEQAEEIRAGAEAETRHLDIIRTAGFHDIRIAKSRRIDPARIACLVARTSPFQRSGY